MKFRKNKTDNMPKSPCLVEMSDVDFGSPRRLFCSYKHSPCAEIFHRNLKEKAGIEAVASFAYGDLKLYPQMQLYVWVQDSAAAEQILKNTPYQSCDRDHPLFRTVIECLIDALQEDNNAALVKISNLWEMQQKNDSNGEDKIYVSVMLLSYLRCYTDDLFGATKNAVSEAFSKHFPTYENLSCHSFSLESGPLVHSRTGVEQNRFCRADFPDIFHNHLYLFFTPEDQKRAEISGDIEKMKKLAYEIIKAKDVHGYISYEAYAPQIVNRRQSTSEQIFFFNRE